MVDSPLAVVPEVGLELNGPFRIQRSAADGRDNVQPAPLHGRIQVEFRRPGIRMPGAEQVGGVLHREGAVPGAHELFRGGGFGVAAMEPAAAVRILFTGQARAVSGVGHG